MFSWEAIAWLAFWVWVVFFGGAERLDGGGWLMAYLVEPMPSKADPVHILRLIGVVNIVLAVGVWVWMLA
jgi:hypothetical protein